MPTTAMNVKILTGGLVLALVCVVVLIVISPTSLDDGQDPKFTNREVIVFSDEAFTTEVQTILTDSTKKVESFLRAAPSGKDIILIDGAWLASGGGSGPSKDQIKNWFEAHIPLIYVNEDSDLNKRTGNNMVYCVYLDSDGDTVLYLPNGNKLEDVLVDAYDWADDILTAASK